MQQEPRRQDRLKIDLLSGDGVAKSQKLRMQEIPAIAGKAGKIFKRPAAEPVQRIAHQGMADGCQMNPDLMRPPRIQAYLKCCGPWCGSCHVGCSVASTA